MLADATKIEVMQLSRRFYALDQTLAPDAGLTSNTYGCDRFELVTTAVTFARHPAGGMKG